MNNNYLARLAFDSLFEKDDLEELKEKDVIDCEDGYRLASVDWMSTKLDVALKDYVIIKPSDIAIISRKAAATAVASILSTMDRNPSQYQDILYKDIKELHKALASKAQE